MAVRKITVTIFTLLLAGFLLWPAFFSQAQTPAPDQQETFEAEVLEILEEKEIIAEDGAKSLQQNIRARGLTGEWKDKEFIYYGISEMQIIGGNVYQKGDRVVVYANQDRAGNEVFYITDYVRRGPIYLLALFFVFLILLISRWKGLKSLVGLAASFLIIMKFIVPQILNGGNPLFIGVTGSFLIVVLAIYLTEGLNKKSTLAIFSLFISLLIVVALSIVAVKFTRMTGMAQEETMYLIGINRGTINFAGLFLTGILIGALGVLDDVVISQIEAVSQIRKANPGLSKKEIFKMSLKIGNAHIGAVVNTLFLAYVGASLPLLLLFYLNQPPFLTFAEVLNNEIVASEIVRTLVGSSGLVLTMPITTFLAAYLYKE